MARYALLALFALAAVSVAAGPNVIVYEAEVFPENLGWERVGTFDADRSLVDGWLIIDVDLGV